MALKRIAVLGSTGSIGRQTLDIISAHPDRLQVVALAANCDWQSLIRQALEFKVQNCCLVFEPAAVHASLQLPKAHIWSGSHGLLTMVEELDVDLVVGAISGGAGLVPVMTALERGLDVALANKEPLVMAGELIRAAAKRSGARLLPIDSELSAIHQCLEGQPHEAIERIMLTASGGPFSKMTTEELDQVTPQQALNHPTWQMGRKVTIDSATLANKGFEMFEVHWLFEVPFSHIQVVVHHQSVIHSLVEFQDSSVLAQMGRPDMRTPIQYALFYPERITNNLPRLDLPTVGALTFANPDESRFPCLRLARQTGELGGGYPAVLNGADETAVELFLKGYIGFNDIPRHIEAALSAYAGITPTTLDEVLEADCWGRNYVLDNVS